MICLILLGFVLMPASTLWSNVEQTLVDELHIVASGAYSTSVRSLLPQTVSNIDKAAAACVHSGTVLRVYSASVSC